MKDSHSSFNENPVRRDVRRVLGDGLTHVEISDDAIQSVADEHADADFELPAWTADATAPVFPAIGEYETEQLIDFFMVGNALNFCFNQFDHTVTNPDVSKWALNPNGTQFDIPWDGAFGMWAGLKESIDNDDLPTLTDADELRHLELEDAVEIFESANEKAMPLLPTRVEMLNDLGSALRMKHDGTFATLFEDADGYLLRDDGNGILQSLSEMSAYYDWRHYDGERVRFDKRAQLGATMLYDRAKHTDEYEFPLHDVEKLTVFADYGVPAVNRYFGIFEYNTDQDVGFESMPPLSVLIDEQYPIPEDCPEEIEIRAATVEAGDRLLEAINNRRPDDEQIGVPELDYWLWKQRNDNDVGNVHLTLTTAY